MIVSEHQSLNSITTFRNNPYDLSVASSASSSAASIWSDASSQSSDDTSASATSLNSSEQCDLYSYAQHGIPSNQQTSKIQTGSHALSGVSQSRPVASELRQNPRRTSLGVPTRTGCPPALTRQSDRKVNFVDSLVDSSTQIVEVIWPLSSVFHRHELGVKNVLPLRSFIQETLRRSRTSYSTLQVALYYLILIKPHVPKYDFTMEQPNDIYANRALQCGRRMFLAALILASKYLQDRNYSARAWSKISGLATQEINQNEMAFLSAVCWKLHITDEVFQRWTEIILKYTPSQPPSPGSSCLQVPDQQVETWKNLILRLNPELDNVKELVPVSPSKKRVREVPFVAARSLFSAPPTSPVVVEAVDANPTPKSYVAPSVMEPSPATAQYTPGRAPALGLLPTPRLTPQSTGFSTPAVSAATCVLNGKSSMHFAMTQAANVCASQNMDRWPGSNNTSPESYMPMRRSSLANSISTASSPESMISDTSRTSRSSSISSASSLVSAPSAKLDVQARCRNAKLYEKRYSTRPAIASVPEDYEENCITSSPESYTGTVGKDFYQMSLDTPTATRGFEMEDADAARALQDLYSYQYCASSQPQPARLGSKRSRPQSIDNSLQDNVRDMLREQYARAERASRIGLIPEKSTAYASSQDGCRKRVRCSSDAYSIPSMHIAAGGNGGVGMWEGIL
ncbi:hypothetical protein F5Y15DRAFT_252524 [Xylariaceae sp. FL0016]|nr:hypothetical protein F5Y15DRAFT_252524 [Xylariaceae sp. FL0016]